MHKVLKKLYLDHAHFSKLMGVLESQLGQFKGGGSPDLAMITDLVDYVGNYVDSIHHPIEDQLYQALLARSDQGRDDMEGLLTQHQIIVNMTREFQQALKSPSRNDAEKVGREFVEMQRSHLRFEEDKAFPLLEQELGSGDFDNAAAALPAVEDPLLDVEMQQRYPALFDYLERERGKLPGVPQAK